MARIITVTSGKGGVGKTSLSLNLALALAAKGMKVCLFDADLGLANVNILTGIYPEQNLESVIYGHCSLDEIMIKDYKGIDLIPGSSGVDKIADLTPEQTKSLITTFLALDDYDYFIFDTSAGISAQVLSFCMASHEIILVATTEPTSLTDAYALLKVLSKHEYGNPIKIVLNQIKSVTLAQTAYSKLKKTVEQFLNVRLEPLGIILQDKNVTRAVAAQTPVIKMFPKSVVSKCIRSIASKLIHKSGTAEDVTMEVFWKNCLAFMEKSCPRKQAPAPDRDTLTRVEEQLALLTKEVAAIKHLIQTRPPIPGTLDNFSKSSSAAPLDFRMYKTRQLLDRASHTMAPQKDKPAVEPIARGRLRNPTKEELENWNQDPVVRLEGSPPLEQAQ